MWDLSMYADGSVSAIWCSHALEHIEKKQVLPTLKEWFRVLRPCGLLQIEVPDLAWVLQNWLENQDNGWNLDAIFGSQETPGQQHKTGFTPLLLEAYLKDAGFINDVYIDFVFNHNQQSIRAEVLK
jgi:predicted SAM-dependent methyltransferase